MNKTGLGKHWYNNGITEGYYLECPVGFVKGRLPIKESTRQKHISNNGMHKLTEDQKQKRSQKLKDYHANLSLEEKQKISKKISSNRKEKGIGKTPWNKGLKSKVEAWNKGLKLSNERKEALSLSLKNRSEENKILTRVKLSQSLKGRIPWNKGISTGEWTDEQKLNFINKQNITKSQNNSFNTSTPEDFCKKYLCNKYGEYDIVYQYSDTRYPFACDFYIKSQDLFVELNLTWTHGNHAFNPTNEEDILLLERWKKKAETSKYYQNAIYTWTDLDVRKLNTFIKNNLNYKIIYNLEEITTL